MAEATVNKYQFLRSSPRFQRMRNRGAIPPPFSVISAVSDIVRAEFEAVVKECGNEASLAAMTTGARLGEVMDASPDEDVSRHLIKALKARLRKAAKESDPETIRIMARELRKAQDEFFREFGEDADDETKARVTTAFVADDRFTKRLSALRDGYLKSAQERISEGKSDLRKRFIELFTDWQDGRGDLKSFEAVMDRCTHEAGVFSRFFARDQFSRFSRTLTVATYEAAGAKWIQWIAVMDGRTRKTHRAINGKIYAIDDLPKEYLDYQCRCSYLPVYKLRGRVVTKGDGIRLNERIAA